jgi:glycosyltransferase involved in cell wall biosynthesis
VKQGVIGYLIPWHCPEPYAERLQVLLSNTALRESMGRAAREKARGMGWNRVAGNLLGLYTTVVRPDLRNVAGA